MRTSEWVSPGHPDKICDCVASAILDMHLANDVNSRVAVEVMIKNSRIHIAGEVSSSKYFTYDEIASTVKNTVSRIGYTAGYQCRWGVDSNGEPNAPSAESLEIDLDLSPQSTDIARGVDNDGWGDQGIFWGYAANDETTDFMPKDVWIARRIGLALYRSGICGLDIKTQVTMLGEDELAQIVVAAPLIDEDSRWKCMGIIGRVLYDCEVSFPSSFVFNGTGMYVRHSSMGDTGVTGRKIVADLYGCNCQVGGGALWGKDWTKADVTLNAYARKLAVERLKAEPELGEVKCLVSTAIGQSRVDICYFNGRDDMIDNCFIDESPRRIAHRLKLDIPRYTSMCMKGMPYVVK